MGRLLSTLRRDMLSVMSNPPSMLPHLSLHMLHQLLPMPTPTLLVCQFMLESTTLASVKPKLTLNTYTTLTLDIHTLLDTPDTLDTPDSTDTPPHTPTATCGTDISTKNQYLIRNMFLLRQFWQNLN